MSSEDGSDPIVVVAAVSPQNILEVHHNATTGPLISSKTAEITVAVLCALKTIKGR